VNRKEAGKFLKSKKFRLLSHGKRPDGSTISVGEVIRHATKLSQTVAAHEHRQKKRKQLVRRVPGVDYDLLSNPFGPGNHCDPRDRT